MGLTARTQIFLFLRELFPEVFVDGWRPEESAEEAARFRADLVLLDFDGVWHGLVAGIPDEGQGKVANFWRAAGEWLGQLAQRYGGGEAELYCLFETPAKGQGVPVVKNVEQDRRAAGGFLKVQVEALGSKLDTISWIDDMAAYGVKHREWAAEALALCGVQLKEEANPVMALWTKSMLTRGQKRRLRCLWMQLALESVWSASPWRQLHLVGAPYLPPRERPDTSAHLLDGSEGPDLAAHYGSRPSSTVYQEGGRAWRHGEECILRVAAGGSASRAVACVPVNMPGEGETKITRYLLEYGRGRRVMVRACDSDVLVYLLLAMRELIEADGEIRTEVWLDMGPRRQGGSTVIDVVQLYRRLLAWVHTAFPTVRNLTEVLMLLWLMPGCDYLISPRGIGWSAMWGAFRHTAAWILPTCIECSRGLRADPFLHIDERAVFHFLRVVYACDFPAAEKRLLKEAEAEAEAEAHRQAAEAAAEAEEEAGDGAKKRKRGSGAGPKKLAKPAARTECGLRVIRAVLEAEGRPAAEVRRAILRELPRQEELLRTATKTREVWTEQQTRGFVRRLCWVLNLFRHAPYGHYQDPLARDHVDRELSRHGWTRTEEHAVRTTDDVCP